MASKCNCIPSNSRPPCTTYRTAVTSSPGIIAATRIAWLLNTSPGECTRTIVRYFERYLRNSVNYKHQLKNVYTCGITRESPLRLINRRLNDLKLTAEEADQWLRSAELNAYCFFDIIGPFLQYIAGSKCKGQSCQEILLRLCKAALC